MHLYIQGIRDPPRGSDNLTQAKLTFVKKLQSITRIESGKGCDRVTRITRNPNQNNKGKKRFSPKMFKKKKRITQMIALLTPFFFNNKIKKNEKLSIKKNLRNQIENMIES